jgi:hypothetical protein
MINEAKNLFINELRFFRLELEKLNYEKCSYHLSRAHIISQLHTFSHLHVHWIMLMYSIKRKEYSEMSGQILRLLVTLPGHMLGRVPYGNTGWSDVGLTQELPLPDDLKYLFQPNQVL